MEQNRNEWVIHVWGKMRDSLELTNVEKFHLDMLEKYKDQQKKFDRIIVNIAMDDINDVNLFGFLKDNIQNVFVVDVDFKMCQNEPMKGEYVTFRPFVFDRIGENVNIFYTHFKGYKSYLRINRESYPMRVSDICEMFWSYMMYDYSLNFDDVQKKLESNSVYSWFIWKRDKQIDDYFYKYHKSLIDYDSKFQEYVADEFCKHSPGSFNWYNLKRIGDSLRDKPEVRNIQTEKLLEFSNCTHFCEVYLMQFLKDDECYSVNDYNKEWMDIDGVAYASIYPVKTIGRDLLENFEKYMIDNSLI